MKILKIILGIILFAIGISILALLITLLGAFMNSAGVNNWFVDFAKAIDIFHFIADGVSPNLLAFAKAIDIFHILGK